MPAVRREHVGQQSCQWQRYSCVLLEDVYVSYNSAWGIVIIVLAVIGLISLSTVSVIIALLWTNPVIKSFGREQLIIILIGLALCFFFSFFYVFRPSVVLCVITRLGFWLSLTTIFGSLLVKLVRVTRIFLGGIKTSSRRYFLKPWHQVLFTFFIVGGQLVSFLFRSSLTIRTLLKPI